VEAALVARPDGTEEESAVGADEVGGVRLGIEGGVQRAVQIVDREGELHSESLAQAARLVRLLVEGLCLADPTAGVRFADLHEDERDAVPAPALGP
jgi:hypothetical protein